MITLKGVNAMSKENREYHYRDILLLPNYSECTSRSEIDLTVKLGKHKFAAPYYPANMKTIIDCELARKLSKAGYFYTLHRFMDYDDIINFSDDMKRNGLISSISVGVKEKDRELINYFDSLFSKFHPDYITIDIAHGDSKHMIDMIGYIKKRLPNTFIIAGNVCTAQGALRLENAGADAVKVGVGPGHACTTKLMTGFSRPQFSSILNVAEGSIDKLNIPIIADGGIEYSGDIAKALVAGATMVMCGYLLAGFEESPGEIIIHSYGRRTKAYYGSASEDNKNAKRNVEGRRLDIPIKGSIWDKLSEINESLQSSCSYAGVNSVRDLKNKVQWVVQS